MSVERQSLLQLREFPGYANKSHPLHRAAARGDTAFLRTLGGILDLSKIKMRDGLGATPLHVAAREGRRECLEWLLENTSEFPRPVSVCRYAVRRSVCEGQSGSGRDANARGGRQGPRLAAAAAGETRGPREPRGAGPDPARTGLQPADGPAPGGAQGAPGRRELDCDGVQVIYIPSESLRTLWPP